MNDYLAREEAYRYFGVHRWPFIRWAALKLLMCHAQMKPEYWDVKFIHKVSDRFRVGTAFSFYIQHQHLYWA